jgi:2-polyprenyl-6-methoxyphenol hydroxylase-like FAD-dependent oxidoreductase
VDTTHAAPAKGEALQRSAVILGGSMSGLLAARAVSRHFARVTVVERDALPDAEALRKGVPQAAHTHGLLASGFRILNEYFPGLMEELEARGAPCGDVVADMVWYQFGRWKLRHQAGLRGITVSRPCLEAAVRRRVRRLPNVTFLDETDGLRPSFDAGARRVVGLVVRARDGGPEQTLDADLVIDASGRGSQSPKWLDGAGYGRPREIAVRANVGYATRVFARQPGDLFGGVGAVVAGTPPRGTRLGAVLAAEDGRWMVTLIGMVGDHPPVDEAAWRAFAATLPVPAIHELVSSARPLSGVVSYRYPASVRRRYERMHRFPAGYLVIGDAVCSFNPIYGQGMSVAAAEAQALEASLIADPGDLWKRFYARARRIVDVPWAIASGEDRRYPQVEGRRTPASRALNRYVEAVHAAASTDRLVCRRFFDVLNLLAPPSALLSPRVAWRVLTRRPPEGAGSPWGSEGQGDEPMQRPGPLDGPASAGAEH